ncbi:hypothetical protein BGZ97_010071 [Linnemannia gamsii]|uniref:Uncharacterized protein n=1 Tax=Linnemannia gamsii TaxID=64522 RepID=A0A9P6R6J9_9FUNG|nr:hypothetical protein BGZ97_010071 [Linnemannia gamsii]
MMPVDNTCTICADCSELFPATGFECVLPMEFRWRHRRVALYLCLDCRLKELSINEEPSPPQVIAYSDTVYGGDVVPRITAIEAKQQYCVDVRMLESLPCKIAYPVKTAVEPGARSSRSKESRLKCPRWDKFERDGTGSGRRFSPRGRGILQRQS